MPISIGFSGCVMIVGEIRVTANPFVTAVLLFLDIAYCPFEPVSAARYSCTNPLHRNYRLLRYEKWCQKFVSSPVLSPSFEGANQLSWQGSFPYLLKHSFLPMRFLNDEETLKEVPGIKSHRKQYTCTCSYSLGQNLRHFGYSRKLSV